MNITHRKMKDKKGKRIATVEAFNMVKKRIKKLNAKLTEANREKKSTEVALEGAERQAETQCKQLRQVEDELAAAKKQTKVLKKKLEDAKKASDQAKQDGYNVGVAETEEALRAKVSGVCRTYGLQVWNEALNLAGVKAFSALRRAENVYYCPAIQALDSSISPDDAAPKYSSSTNEIPAKDLPPPNSPPKGAEQAGTAEKEKENLKEVAPEITKPPTTPKDSFEGKVVSQSHELVLATFLIPAKEESKGKGPTSSATTTTQSTKTPAKDNIVIKMK